MSYRPNTALVPFHGKLPARRSGPQPGPRAGVDPYALSAGATRLESRAEVERYLPDILGRALARCWIDADFRTRFCADPDGTLAQHRIELPATIRIEVVTKGQTRPMVIVQERQQGSTQMRRLLYLQLVMVAGK